jgi:hypothetical protein
MDASNYTRAVRGEKVILPAGFRRADLAVQIFRNRDVDFASQTGSSRGELLRLARDPGCICKQLLSGRGRVDRQRSRPTGELRSYIVHFGQGNSRAAILSAHDGGVAVRSQRH